MGMVIPLCSYVREADIEADAAIKLTLFYAFCYYENFMYTIIWMEC